VKKELKKVEVSRLGFLFAKHQLSVLFGVDEHAWRRERWAALVMAGLQAYMLHLRNVHYAVMRSPITGKQAIVLIDQSTSALLIHAQFASTVAANVQPSCSVNILLFGWNTLRGLLHSEAQSSHGQH
jgi:hypothetical protein